MVHLETYYFTGRICPSCKEKQYAGGRNEKIYCKEGCPKNNKSNEKPVVTGKKKGKNVGKFGERKKPKFTKRHFIDTANMIKDMPEPMRSKWAEQKAKEYAAGNPQFDHAKFMKACGV
jgi:hypothetical protein